MIYKFRIVSDEVDNFKREICIDSDASFLELHDAILDSVGFSKDQMTSFFICDDDWEKKTEITLMDMGKDSDEDTWIMASTKLSDLIEDEGQRLVFVFDYMTDRMFFMELKEIEPGKDLETPVCTRKEGNPPQQTMDFEELEKKNAANNSSDFDETFYGTRRRRICRSEYGRRIQQYVTKNDNSIKTRRIRHSYSPRFLFYNRNGDTTSTSAVTELTQIDTLPRTQIKGSASYRNSQRSSQ